LGTAGAFEVKEHYFFSGMVRPIIFPIFKIFFCFSLFWERSGAVLIFRL
jgi:hypothetical protein